MVSRELYIVVMKLGDWGGRASLRFLLSRRSHFTTTSDLTKMLRLLAHTASVRQI